MDQRSGLVRVGPSRLVKPCRYIVRRRIFLHHPFFCVGVQPFELCLSDSHSWNHPSVLLPSVHGSSQLLRPLPPSAKSAKKALLQSRPTKWREGLSPVTLLGYVERGEGADPFTQEKRRGGERHDRKARKREERESVGGGGGGGAAVVPPLLSTHLPRLQSFL